MAKPQISDLVAEINNLLSRPLGSATRVASGTAFQQRERLKYLRAQLTNLGDQSDQTAQIVLDELFEECNLLISQIQSEQKQLQFDTPTVSQPSEQLLTHAQDQVQPQPPDQVQAQIPDQLFESQLFEPEFEPEFEPKDAQSIGVTPISPPTPELDWTKETSDMSSRKSHATENQTNEQIAAIVQELVQKTVQQSVQQTLAQSLPVERALMIGEITSNLRSLIESQARSQLKNDLQALEQQKQELAQEIESLKSARQAQISQLSDQQHYQQTAIAESVQSISQSIGQSISGQLQHQIESEVNQIFQKIQPPSQSQSPSALVVDSNADLMHKVQQQTDQFLNTLDAMFAATFQSLEQEAQSFKVSLADQLEQMHNTEQRSRVMLDALVERVAAQLESMPVPSLPASSAASGAIASFPSFTAPESQPVNSTTVPVVTEILSDPTAQAGADEPATNAFTVQDLINNLQADPLATFSTELQLDDETVELAKEINIPETEIPEAEILASTLGAEDFSELSTASENEKELADLDDLFRGLESDSNHDLDAAISELERSPIAQPINPDFDPDAITQIVEPISFDFENTLASHDFGLDIAELDSLSVDQTINPDFDSDAITQVVEPINFDFGGTPSSLINQDLDLNAELGLDVGDTDYSANSSHASTDSPLLEFDSLNPDFDADAITQFAEPLVLSEDEDADLIAWLEDRTDDRSSSSPINFSSTISTETAPITENENTEIPEPEEDLDLLSWLEFQSQDSFSNPSTASDEFNLDAIDSQAQGSSANSHDASLSDDDRELLEWLEQKSSHPSLDNFVVDSHIDMAGSEFKQNLEPINFDDSLHSSQSSIPIEHSPLLEVEPSVHELTTPIEAIPLADIPNDLIGMVTSDADDVSNTDESLILLAQSDTEGDNQSWIDEEIIQELSDDLESLDAGIGASPLIAANLDLVIRNTPYSPNVNQSEEISDESINLVDVDAEEVIDGGMTSASGEVAVSTDGWAKELESLMAGSLEESNLENITLGGDEDQVLSELSNEMEALFTESENLPHANVISARANTLEFEVMATDLTGLDENFASAKAIADIHEEKSVNSVNSVNIDTLDVPDMQVDIALDDSIAPESDAPESSSNNAVPALDQELADLMQSLEMNFEQDDDTILQGFESSEEFETVLQGYNEENDLNNMFEGLAPNFELESDQDFLGSLLDDEKLNEFADSLSDSTFEFLGLNQEIPDSVQDLPVNDQNIDQFTNSLEPSLEEDLLDTTDELKLNEFADLDAQSNTLESYNVSPSANDSQDWDAVIFNLPNLESESQIETTSNISNLQSPNQPFDSLDFGNDFVDITASVVADHPSQASSQTSYGQNASPPPRAIAYHITDTWFLGIDFGSACVRASLVNANTRYIYPLLVGGIEDTLSSTAVYTPEQAIEDPMQMAIRFTAGQAQVVSQPSESDSPEIAISHFKHLLKLGLPYFGINSWQPVLQWSQDRQISLRWFLSVIKQLLVAIQTSATHPDLPDAEAILHNLSGVILGYPTEWSDTYVLNLREAVLNANLVTQPEQVMVVEQAIAPLLTLIHDNRLPQQATLIIDAGAYTTGLFLVKANGEPISRGNTNSRSIDYAGLGIDQDIVTQLLYPHWQLITNPEREVCNLDHLDIPEPGNPDPVKRILLQQYLQSSTVGQKLLETAASLKLELSRYPELDQWTGEIHGQPLTVFRRELEGQILLPYRQFVNHILNDLLSNSGISAEDIGVVWQMGGTMRFPNMFHWLTQKFPNANIDRLPSSTVASGLAIAPLYPHLLNIARQQYSDYFLLQEICRLNLKDAVNLNSLMQQLQNRGVNVKSCRDRILNILQGDLPRGIFPWQEPEKAIVLDDPTISTELFIGRLFELETDGSYQPNLKKFQLLSAYLQSILNNMQQTLNEPLVFPDFAVSGYSLPS